MTSKVAMIGME